MARRCGTCGIFAAGVAIACVMLVFACGGGGSGSFETPLARVRTIEHAYLMEYALDAEGRIKSYELRDEASGNRVQWCTGDLRRSWECRAEAHSPTSSLAATFDEQGHPVSYSDIADAPWGTNIQYSHDPGGRLVGVSRNRYSYGDTTTWTSALEYDAAGHLAVIRVHVFSIKSPGLRGDAVYSVVTPGAVPTRVLLTKSGFSVGDFVVQLDHDGTGRYTRKVVNEVLATGERVASTLNYIIDSHGYLTSRVSEQYQYDPGLTPVLRTEETWCLEWVAAAYPALAGESYCPSSTVYYSIAYPDLRAPSAPLTVFPAYSASSALDLLCVIADECVDPARMGPRP